MRHYIAGVVVTGLDFICHLFNHYPLPCFWTSNRLYWWAFDITHPMEPIRQPYSHVVKDVVNNPGTVTTYTSGSGTTRWIDLRSNA